MVEEVTREEFDKFTELIEDRLDKMEEDTKKRLDDHLNAFGELTAQVDKASVTMNKRIDEIEERTGKSVITRIKEALTPE